MIGGCLNHQKLYIVVQVDGILVQLFNIANILENAGPGFQLQFVGVGEGVLVLQGGEVLVHLQIVLLVS